jgi:hypothetical protein
MRIIQHAINQGSNDIPLTTEFINRVEFETNATTYTLTFSKHGRYSISSSVTIQFSLRSVQSTGEVPSSPCGSSGLSQNQSEPINPSIFIACRDGLTHLTVESTCCGVLSLYLENYCEYTEKDNTMSEIAKFRQAARDKHYQKYFNNGIFTYSILKDFKHHISDKDECQMFANTVKYDSENVKEIYLFKTMQLITSITVTSPVETRCALQVEPDHEITSLTIQPGTHTYPLVIPNFAACFNHLRLFFNDAVNCKINFFVLPHEYIRPIDIELPDYGARCMMGTMCRVRD